MHQHMPETLGISVLGKPKRGYSGGSPEQVSISGRTPVWGVRHEYANLPPFSTPRNSGSLMRPRAFVRWVRYDAFQKFHHSSTKRQLVMHCVFAQTCMRCTFQIHTPGRMLHAVLFLSQQSQQFLTTVAGERKINPLPYSSKLTTCRTRLRLMSQRTEFILGTRSIHGRHQLELSGNQHSHQTVR